MSRKLMILAALGTGGLGAWFLFSPLEPGSAASGAGPLLILYSGRDFTGRSLEVIGTLADLPRVTGPEGEEFDWNDSVRSLRVVRGVFRLYQHGRMNTELDETPLELLDLSSRPPAGGWSCLVSATSAGPLEVAAPELGGFGEDISSVELISDENLPDWAGP